MYQRVTVVIATRNRRSQLARTLAKLTELPEAPPVIVIDNASTDGTPEAVAPFPNAAVVTLDTNRGASARTFGVERATTPYVAFSDDDSWWEPGALTRAADVLDASPSMAVLAARVLVGPDARLDPVCEAMAASPLPDDPDIRGRSVLGFLACGAVVRRSAYLSVGGFDDLLFIMGEEQLLALDLVAMGWSVSYVDGVVAHHHPSPSPDRGGRRQLEVRNAILAAWMRRPKRRALARSVGCLAAGGRDLAVRRGVVDAARSLPLALLRRRPLPRDVERRLRLVERA
jgi:GT2 family glycosyltransferase